MSKKTPAEDTPIEAGCLVSENEGDGNNAPVVAENSTAQKTNRVKCIIRNQSGEDGKHPVFARLICDRGAYEAYIPRETEVEIPDYVYDFLKDTEGYEVVPQQVNGKTEMVNKSFKRFIIERV